jgi:hypothetical protein
VLQPPDGIQVPPGQAGAGGSAPHGDPSHAHAEDAEIIYIKTPPPPGCQTYWFAYLGDLVPRCGCDENCGECPMCRIKNACGPRDVGWGYQWTFGETGDWPGHGGYGSGYGGYGGGHGGAPGGGHGNSYPPESDEFAALKQQHLLPPEYSGGPISPSYIASLKQQGILPGDFFPGMTTHHAADMMRRGLLPPGYRGGYIPSTHIEHLKRQGMLPPNFDSGMAHGHGGGNGYGGNGYGGNGHNGNGHGGNGHDGLSPYDYLSQLKQHGMLSPGYPNGVGVIDPESYMEQLRRQGLVPPNYGQGGTGDGRDPYGSGSGSGHGNPYAGGPYAGHDGHGQRGDAPDHITDLKRRGLLPPDYVPGQPKIYPQHYLAALARRGLLPPHYQPGRGLDVTGPGLMYARRYGVRMPWQGYSMQPGMVQYGMLTLPGIQQRLENYESPSLGANHKFPQFGALSVAYETNPWYFDKRDGAVYPALGYGQPLAMPLAPTVHHTYNFGWGMPVSRLTPIWRNPNQQGQ